MAKYCGKDFRLYVDTDGAPTWVLVLGERTSSITISNEQVDATSKDDTPWRQLIDCGIRAASISASGVFSQGTGIAKIRTVFFSGGLIHAKIESGAGIVLEGEFLVSSFERTGEYNGAEMYSLGLESGAGQPVIEVSGP